MFKNLSVLNSYRVRVLNTIFNNISAISWRSALLVEETGVSGSHRQTEFLYTDRQFSNFVSIDQ
jgi:hypothetical protein